MESAFGLNSPDFLQKKIERLKSALDEANVLMDRQVAERDEARAQLDALKRENEELKREIAEGGNVASSESQPSAVDPALEAELRERITELERERERDRELARERERERERERLHATQPDADQQLQERVDSLQRELDGAHRDLEASRQDADVARRDTEAARHDADAARRDTEAARHDADAARAAAAAAQTLPAIAGRRPPADTDLPAPGPFVSQEVIRDALENDNFVLFCQPVFSLHAERITQYELLLRLRDPQGRLVRPFGFLEPADRYGLMAEIDRWVVHHALELLARDSSGDLRLEVNLAGQSLGDPELTAIIEQQIAMTDLDPARLILEVSENVAAANLEDCKRLAKRLRGLGCGFALDDFGSTFASFRHLRDLPINFLKIDGDLVVTVTESRTGQLTIKSLVELAKGLGAETVAEYVSDDQTLEFLREQGVGYAQGYRIGRPRPIEEVLGPHAAHEQQPQPPKRVERPALGTGDDEPAEATEATEPDEPNQPNEAFHYSATPPDEPREQFYGAGGGDITPSETI